MHPTAEGVNQNSLVESTTRVRGIMHRSQLRWAALLAAAVLLLGACNAFKFSSSTDDKAITSNIQAKLFADPVLKTRDIRVDSRKGVVTISGTVGTDLERAAVERIATQEEGVRSVDNVLGLTSQPAAPTSEATQTAESIPPSQPVEASAPLPEPAATPKPRRAHHAAAEAQEVSASTESNVGTDPEGSNTAVNPASSSAPAPSPAPAQTPVAAPPVAVTPATPAPAPAPEPQQHLEIPSGTVVTIRMIDNIDSSRNRPGEEFAASLDSPIVLGDRVVASRGSDARVRLVNAASAGHISGESELQLELISVTINGTPYSTKSGYYEQHGASRGTRTAETVGGGAVLGALIGGLLGHGKGAAIGSAVGAGTGTAVQVSTQGQQVKVPAETKLDFTLKEPVNIPMDGSQ